MTGERFTLACGDYELTRPVMDGRVKPEGCEINPVVIDPPGEMFWRMMRHGEFDISELSLSAFIMGISRGDDRFVGLPVFPFRSFRHHYIFVNEKAGIDTPQDLRGKRVGVPEYHMTAALHIRGMLRDEYGVEPSDIEWFQGGQDRPGREERIQLRLPSSIRLTKLPPGVTLRAMLLNGELDALFTSRVPPELHDPGPIRRLFPDYRGVVVNYWRRTRIFPIMHLVVVRRDVYEQHRWLAQALVKAFETAKTIAVDRLHAHAPASPLPFFLDELERTLDEFGGPSLWSYDIESNRPSLEAALRYSYEQGLSEREVSLEDLFAPPTRAPYHESMPAQVEPPVATDPEPSA